MIVLAERARLHERVDELRQALLEQVVAEIHHEVVVTEVVARDEDAMGKAERSVLLDIGDVESPPRAIADCGDDVFARVADDDADLFDAGGRHVFEPVEQDRLVRHGHELLRVRVCDGAKPRPSAPAEDQALHLVGMLGDVRAASVLLGRVGVWVRLARDLPYPAEQIRSVTLLIDAGRLVVDVTAAIPVQETDVDPKRVAAVDLGIIHPYAVVLDDQALLVSGRAIRAEERLHLADTKARARHLSPKAPRRGQRGSRRWRKLRARATPRRGAASSPRSPGPP